MRHPTLSASQRSNKPHADAVEQLRDVVEGLCAFTGWLHANSDRVRQTTPHGGRALYWIAVSDKAHKPAGPAGYSLNICMPGTTGQCMVLDVGRYLGSEFLTFFN